MNQPNTFDISVRLGEESVDYPGDTPFSRNLIATLADGGFCDLSRLEMSAHSGTHIDSPAHFLKGGKTLDAYPLERFMLSAQVIAVDDPESIKPAELEDMTISPGEAVLFKTRNSLDGLVRSASFTEKFVYMTGPAAELLVERKAGLVGIDYITIEQYGGTGFPVHDALLKNDILILEGIDLQQAPPGRYRLYCFPLKIKGAEASPVRAVLTTQEG
ncbi:MAG: cyclase family protein [Thermodesulfobacteriota bacterium]